MFVASGGDDQHLAVMEIDAESLEVLRKHKQYAHSSAIKGVCLMDEGECLKIASSSYDQRYREWTVVIS